MLRRIKATIAYDGFDYYGFQAQSNKLAIANILNATLSKICDEEITVTSASRTDRKVHATDQRFHFDTNSLIEISKLEYALNKQLPTSMAVRNMTATTTDFHCRASVTSKEYRYYLSTSNDPFLKRYTGQYLFKALDLEKMQRCTKLFVGTHNFSSFCTNDEKSKKSYIRTVENLEINSFNNLIEFVISGNGFLRSMVRMIVGTLVEVGKNKIDESYITSRLDKERNTTIYKIAPEGLYLVSVKYQYDLTSEVKLPMPYYLMKWNYLAHLTLF